jgi:glycosyltransferase involved in cell wall biosynthesis
LPDEGATLGALRNRALAAAAGVYVCQWDDDDLYDPARLATQMAALAAMRADACFLGRWALWWPRRQRLAISTQRVWEGSMLCRKAKVPPYPAVRRGEDTPGAEQIARTGRVVFLDQPRLYVYAVHDGNTFEPSHFESHWQAASPQFTGAAYERVLQELRKGLDIDGYLSALDTRGSGAVPELATTHPGAVSAVAPAPDPGNSRPQHRAKVTRARRARSPAADLPTILILTPAKNAARFVPRYFELVARLDYPRDKLSLALLEGDSEDGTYEALQRAAERHRRAFARIDLHQHSYSFVLEGDRWEAQKQYSRRSVISKCRNKLFAMADRGADRILWIDADVIDYEAEVLLRLIDADRPIVVPHCVQTPAGPTFDLNSFKFKPAAQERAWTHMVDGIIQPPRGWGRLYLDDFRGDPGLVELDGVGGTMLLVDAAIHRQGIVFPDYSYRGYLDTEGFAFHARDRGFSAWGLPDLEIIHASE